MINIQQLYLLLTNYKYRYFGFLLLGVIIIIVDQITKEAVVNYLQHGEDISITSFFSIILTYNSGAAFSILSNAGGWQRVFLSLISIMAVVIILIWMLAELKDKRKLWALSLLLGGAAGNLIDRINTGRVVDFMLFGYNNWYFPAFNIADICISLGAFILIITVYIAKKN